MDAAPIASASTAGGSLLWLAIILPVVGILASLLSGGRHAERIALLLMPTGFGIAISIAIFLWRSGQPLVYVIGGFNPPLGIALRGWLLGGHACDDSIDSRRCRVLCAR